jgi:riboflavin kinase/FMN adenylyltransferase
LPQGISVGFSPIPTVVTFYPHPQEFFSQQSRPWLTPLDEKAMTLKSLGVRQLVLLPFNQALATLQPEAFVQEILLDRLQAKHISVGADFRFGADRMGTVDLLQQLADQRGISVTVLALAQAGGDRISSSRIRQALCAGDLETVHQLMGRPYALRGRVVTGQKLGRQLGFPTANLQIPEDKFLPRTGVYSVKVYGVPKATGVSIPGVMNLGVRPTVAGQTQTVEVHLLNWSGDLYGQTLTVTLESFLRPEQRFDSLEHLKAQIQADCQAAQAIL